MARYVIVPIVEGHGEVHAVPILLQNWLRFRRYHNVEVHVEGPVRASGKGAIKVPHDRNNELGVEHYLQLALLRRPDAILVLLDADEECPKTLASSLLFRIRSLVSSRCPVGVVIAKREYEAWFLAAFSTSAFRNGLRELGFALERNSLPSTTEVEEIADCKRYLAKLIGLKKYEPTIHQPALTKILAFKPGATRRSRSFRKLLKELHSILVQARRRRR